MTNIILSFDIGTRNFAFCLVHYKEGECTIQNWNNINLQGETAEECSSACVAFLKEYTTNLPDNHNTYVLIERQLPQNIPCMCLSHTVFAFFLTRFKDMNVSFVGANNKPLLNLGKRRKAEAIQAITRYLNATPRHAVFKDWFQSQNKKDDLADCLLQILATATKLEYKPVPRIVIVIDD